MFLIIIKYKFLSCVFKQHFYSYFNLNHYYYYYYHLHHGYFLLTWHFHTLSDFHVSDRSETWTIFLLNTKCNIHHNCLLLLLLNYINCLNVLAWNDCITRNDGFDKTVNNVWMVYGLVILLFINHQETRKSRRGYTWYNVNI